MIILSVLGFVSTKVLVSTLGIEYNGLNGVFTNIITILSITELGLGGAITYNLYKPIVDKNKAIKKLEALIRWNNRKLGYISPDKFIEYGGSEYL